MDVGPGILVSLETIAVTPGTRVLLPIFITEIRFSIELYSYTSRVSNNAPMSGFTFTGSSNALMPGHTFIYSFQQYSYARTYIHSYWKCMQLKLNTTEQVLAYDYR